VHFDRQKGTEMYIPSSSLTSPVIEELFHARPGSGTRSKSFVPFMQS